MDILKFTLSGNYAHFRNPEINNINLTFLQIHKTIIKGIVGAIIGLDGYNTSNLKNKSNVEFLDTLENIKIGIIPNVDKGIFPTEIISYVNQTGQASRQEGGCLIVKEKVLINPSWDIYLDLSLLEKEVQDKIKDYVLNSNSEYPYYFGKNHYFAEISNPSLFETARIEEPEYISSLFVKKGIVLDDEIEDSNDLVYGKNPILTSFIVPLDKDNDCGYTNYKNLYYTNYYIDEIENAENRYFIQDGSNKEEKAKIIEML